MSQAGDQSVLGLGESRWGMGGSDPPAASGSGGSGDPNVVPEGLSMMSSTLSSSPAGQFSSAVEITRANLLHPQTAHVLNSDKLGGTPDSQHSGPVVGPLPSMEEAVPPSVAEAAVIDADVPAPLLATPARRALLDDPNEGPEEKDDWKHCRHYFFAGCMAAPLLLFINVAYYVRERRKGERNVVLKSYTLPSIIVALFWILVMLVWFLVYFFVLQKKKGWEWLGIQNHRLGDQLI